MEWQVKYVNTYDKNIIKKFGNWFIKIVETQLNNVFNRITKAAATLYDDIEPEHDEYKLYKLIQKKLKEKQNINESYNPEQTEIISILIKNKFNQYIKFNIKYNSVIE